jgi:hypothetical protein
MQPVPIITNVVDYNPSHGKVYLIQHYVIKFVSDWQQVADFLIKYNSKVLPQYVLNTTFNNVSIISWLSVLLVEYVEKISDLLPVADKLYDIM